MTVKFEIETVKFDDKGLIPAIAQQFDTGEVLMMAWMNKDSLAETLASAQVTYWSRSRQELWRKGATSGHHQVLKSLTIDCDRDLHFDAGRSNGCCVSHKSALLFLHSDRKWPGNRIVTTYRVRCSKSRISAGDAPCDRYMLTAMAS